MKTYIIISLFCFSYFHAYSQKASVCHYYGENANFTASEICDYLSFVSNYEAENTVDEILKQVGLKRNFIIIECPNINNAQAVNWPSEIGNVRYIIYDNEFLKRVKSTTNTDWGAISILAHEVGHHLNGHTLDRSMDKHKRELEADEFSGFVLAKLGATLEQAKSAINHFVPISATSTHPGKLERIKAIETGYNSAKSLEIQTVENSTIKVDEIKRVDLNSKYLKYNNVKSQISYKLRECQSELNNKIKNAKYYIDYNLAYDLYQILGSVNSELTYSERREYTSDLKIFENIINDYAIFAFQEQNYDLAYQYFSASLDVSQILHENNVISRLSDKKIWNEQIFYTAASAYFSNKYKNESIKYFEELSYNKTPYPLVYVALFTQYSEKDISKAFIYLEKGKKLFPSDSEILFAEINYYIKVGRLDMLINKLELAIKKEPDNLSVYNALGNVYDQLYHNERNTGNITKANEYFDLALKNFKIVTKKDPNNFDAIYSQGALYYNKAAILISKMNEISNDFSTEGNNKYNSLKAEMNDCFNKALPFFIKAESLNSNDREVLTALKEIYTLQGNQSKANYYNNKIK